MDAPYPTEHLRPDRLQSWQIPHRGRAAAAGRRAQFPSARLGGRPRRTGTCHQPGAPRPPDHPAPPQPSPSAYLKRLFGPNDRLERESRSFQQRLPAEPLMRHSVSSSRSGLCSSHASGIGWTGWDPSGCSPKAKPGIGSRLPMSVTDTCSRRPDGFGATGRRPIRQYLVRIETEHMGLRITPATRLRAEATARQSRPMSRTFGALPRLL